jgi:hypothetical protein
LFALSGEARRLGVDGWGNLTNVQCKAIQNCHKESPLYNEYMLIKMKTNKQAKTWGVLKTVEGKQQEFYRS